jgi:hypothetical protein
MVTGYKRGNMEQGIRYRHRLIGTILVAAVVAFWVVGPDALPSLSSAATSAASVAKHASARRAHD